LINPSIEGLKHLTNGVLNLGRKRLNN